MALFTVLALGMGLQRGAPDASAPTAMEQALIEHRCRTTQVAGPPGTDAYQECPNVQLLSLRTEFGRDLSRLSAAERKTIDSVCSKIRTSQGRDAYVDCLNGQLVALTNRRNRSKPDSSAAPPPPLPLESDPSSTSPGPPALPASSWFSPLWIGVMVVGLSIAVGGVLLAMKARRPARKCRVCGTSVPDSGDLCQKCRHEAAEAVKRAAAERADHLRAQEEQRRQAEHEEVQRRQKILEQEDARLRQEERARQEAQARLEADARQWEEEEARQRRQTGASEEGFDPYTVLGVSPDASQEDIRAAYQEAKLKYDSTQVAHLGFELKEHYKAKALAVERAYQQLAR